MSELCPPDWNTKSSLLGNTCVKFPFQKLKKLQNRNICNGDVLPNRLIHNFSSQVLVSVVDCNESGKCIKIVIICKSINFFSFKFLTATTCSSIFNLDRSIVNYKSYLYNNQRLLGTSSKLALRTCLIVKSSVSIQTKLCSHWFNYHYMCILKNCS